MFRLKDILYLCDHGLKDAVFLPIEASKCTVEVKDGIARFVWANGVSPIEDRVCDHPDIVDKWVNEFVTESIDDKGNIKYAESYLYVLQPFYKEVIDFYGYAFYVNN